MFYSVLAPSLTSLGWVPWPLSEMKFDQTNVTKPKWHRAQTSVCHHKRKRERVKDKKMDDLRDHKQEKDCNTPPALNAAKKTWKGPWETSFFFIIDNYKMDHQEPAGLGDEENG